MHQPWVATASDGSSMAPGNTVPHPCSYGCFVARSGYYSMAEKALPLEQALRSCVNGFVGGYPAPKEPRLPENRPVADLVVLDPKTFADKVNFSTSPTSNSDSVKYLFVNGKTGHRQRQV